MMRFRASMNRDGTSEMGFNISWPWLIGGFIIGFLVMHFLF